MLVNLDVCSTMWHFIQIPVCLSPVCQHFSYLVYIPHNIGLDLIIWASEECPCAILYSVRNCLTTFVLFWLFEPLWQSIRSKNTIWLFNQLSFTKPWRTIQCFKIVWYTIFILEVLHDDYMLLQVVHASRVEANVTGHKAEPFLLQQVHYFQ